MRLYGSGPVRTQQERVSVPHMNCVSCTYLCTVKAWHGFQVCIINVMAQSNSTVCVILAQNLPGYELA
jgi:hypothetical protein